MVFSEQLGKSRVSGTALFTYWVLAGISGAAEKLDSARADCHGLANTAVLGSSELLCGRSALPERGLQETQADATRLLVI